MAIKFLNSTDTDSGVLYVDAINNRVGIGTTTPSQELHIEGYTLINSTEASALQIQRSGITRIQSDASGSNGGFVFTGSLGNKFVVGANGNDFQITDGAYSGNGDVRLTISSSGNVGIGTTSPDKKLTVSQSSDTSGLRIYGYDDKSTSFVDLYVDAGGNTRFTQSNPNTTGYLQISAQTYLSLDAPGLVYTSSTFRIYDAGRLDIGSSGDYKIKYDSTNDILNIHTDDNKGITIDNTGNVGIGTTSPNQKLHVDGNIRVGDVNDVIYSNRFTTLSNSNLLITANTGYDTTFTNGGSERMRITSAGNVGIATTGPYTGAKLHVSAHDTSPSLNGTVPTDITAIFSNSDVAYGTMFATDSSGKGYIQQRRTNSATYYDLLVQPYGGNVGIGTTSPTAPLHIANDAPTIRLEDATSGDNHYLTGNNGELRVQSTGFISMRPGNTTSTTFLANGNVGIGTTSPSANLHISGSADQVLVENTASNGSAKIRFKSRSDRDSGPYIQSTARGSVSSDSDLRIGDENGDIATFNGGRVGIGTASPSKTLHVLTDDNEGIYLQGTGGGVWMNIQSGGGGELHSIGSQVSGMGIYNRTQSSYRMFINNAGNVGIGTTSPSKALDVVGEGKFSSYLNVEASTGIRSTAGWVHLQRYQTNLHVAVGNNGSGVNLYVPNGNVGVGTNTPNNRLDIRRANSGTVAEFHSTAGTADEYVDIKLISGNTTAGTYGTILRHQRVGTDGADFAILTNPTLTGTPVERFRITRDGEVGIGTAAPNVKLEIKGNASENVQLRLQTDGSATEEPTILFRRNSSAYGEIKYRADGGGSQGIHITDYRSDASNIIFKTAGSNERMRISHTGNVGIGTTSPAEKLHVVGDANITKSVYSSSHTSGTITNDNWYRIIEINGGSGRGKCEFALGSGGGSGTPFVCRGAVTTAWANSNSTITIYHNSLGAVKEMRVVRNATDNKSYVDVKMSTEDSVTIQTLSNFVDSATAVDFTNVTTLPANDTIETTLPLTGVTLGSSTNSTTNQFKVYTNSSLDANGGYFAGNVGIGTTSPSDKLSIVGSVSVSAGNAYKMYNPAGTAWGEMRFNDTNNRIQFNRGIQNSGADFLFHENGDSYINANQGNVGIGLTNPSEKLHVDGNIKANGSVSVTNIVTNRIVKFNGSILDDSSIYDNGNVGIGTTSPSEKLDVVGDIKASADIHVGGDIVSTATSLYDLLPNISTTFTLTTTLVANTWTSVTTGNTDIPGSGTYAIQVYFNDHAVGGTGYAQTYSGTITWASSTSTNNAGYDAISEVPLHRSGHAANSQTIYLRTAERTTSSLELQIKSDRGHTADTDFVFKLIKLI